MRKQFVARTKRVALLVVSLCFMFSISSSPTFAASDVKSQVLSKVVDLYDEYYTISNARADVVETKRNSDGSTSYVISASFDRTLKETSAYEMPFVQGLIAAKADLTMKQDVDTADAYIDFWVKELTANYINVPQSTNIILTVTIPAFIPQTPLRESDIFYRDELSQTDFNLENLAPKNNKEAFLDAQIAMEAVLKEVNAEAYEVARMGTQAVRTYSYNRGVACSYAMTWSCSTGANIDHEGCHHPDYDFINGEDCANFVSQCLVAGGIPMDSTWHSGSGSTAWYTTGNHGNGLRQYVVGTLGFIHTTLIARVPAGSIVNLLNSSGANAGHVGIVNQNDTRVLTLCAHTSCRSSYPVSQWVYYDFYAPQLDIPIM